MKKLLLCASVLSLSLSLANAQGITATNAYDDFNGTGYSAVTPVGSGIYWWGGPAVVTTSRAGGKLSFSYDEASETNFVVDFGTSPTGEPDAGTKRSLNLSAMADVEVVIENSSDDQLIMRVVLEDNAGVQANIEPNVSDCVGIDDFETPLTGVTWPNGDAVYPFQAFNGFVLEPNSTKTFRIDLSSVSGAVGGLTAGSYGNNKPSDSPNASYLINPAQIHAVLFRFGEVDEYHLSGNATNLDSYKFDTTVSAVDTYTGDIILHSFKIGNILSPLGLPTSINTDAAVDGSLKAYPNPAKETLNVTFESTTGATVALTDIYGNAVYTTAANAGENEIRVNTSTLTKGMYILNVTTEKGKASRKVSIQ